jgi:hypothetical protein
VTDGLESFQLKPSSKKGIELLNHMHAFAMRDPQHERRAGEPLEPSTFLDLAISEVQLALVLTPSSRDVTMRELMKDAGGDGATMKIPKRKLNVFGTIQSHSGLANDEKQLKKLKNKHTMAASLAHISRLGKKEAAAKDEDEARKRRQAYDGAIAKLSIKEGDISMLSKLEIASILLVDYQIDVGSLNNKNNQKPALVARLVDAQRASGQTSVLAAATSVAATIPTVDTVIPAAMDSDSDREVDLVHGGHVLEHHFDED